MYDAGSSSEFGAGFDAHLGAGFGAAAEAGFGVEREAGSGVGFGVERAAGSGSGFGVERVDGSGAGFSARREAASDATSGARFGSGSGPGLGADSGAPSVAPLVPVQRGVRDAARGEVLLRHARLASSGRPVFCTPSRAELAGLVGPRAGRGTDGKVIYSTREAAEAAARELEALGSRALRAYRCTRSRRGHFHLTTDTTSRPHLPLHLRIPQPRLSA